MKLNLFDTLCRRKAVQGEAKTVKSYSADRSIAVLATKCSLSVSCVSLHFQKLIGPTKDKQQ